MTCATDASPQPALTRDQKLALAIQEYQDNPNQSVLGNPKRHGVAPSTLQGWLKGAQPRAVTMGDRHLISLAESQEIAAHTSHMQDLYFPLTPADIKREAEHVLHAKDPVAKANNMCLRKDWYHEVFLKDNPEMRNKLGKGLDRNWATCASQGQLTAWHEDVCDSTLIVDSLLTVLSTAG